MSEPNADPPPATNLRVRVSYDGQEKVALSLPAAATANLAQLIPPEIAEKLKADGVDVAAVAANAVANGLPVGDLFEATAGTKHVRVWLS